MKAKPYRPYNLTFECYAETPMTLKQALKFIEYKNQYKGGHWILHTEEVFQSKHIKHTKEETDAFIKKVNAWLLDYNSVVRFNEPLYVIVPADRIGKQ
jgi:hypothetical protein